MNRVQRFISNILEFITNFIYEEEIYNKWMDQVERLRGKVNEQDCEI